MQYEEKTTFLHVSNLTDKELQYLYDEVRLEIMGRDLIKAWKEMQVIQEQDKKGEKK